MRIVYLGSGGALSLLPLERLLDTGAGVAGVGVAGGAVVPPAVQAIPVMAGSRTSLSSLAAARGLPVLGLSGEWSRETGLLADWRPDVILVSCFPYRLPVTLLEMPPQGCFNLHPSLLPAYRGPVPVYWQLADHVRESGVSLHRMTPDLDAGPVVGQRAVRLPEACGVEEAADLLARAGTAVILEVLTQLAQGTLEEQAQDESRASYRGFPPMTALKSD